MRFADGGYVESLRTKGIEGSTNWTFKDGNDRFGVKVNDFVRLATVYVVAFILYDIVDNGGLNPEVSITLKVKRS